jgi:hypothetical protein
MLYHRASRGLYYDMRGGRSCTIKDEAMAELILKIATKPKAATHWSVRAIVHLSFLQPHRPIPLRHRGAGAT